MVRQLGQRVRVLGGRLQFEYLGDALMGALAAGRTQLVVEAVLHERVGESVAAHVGALHEHRRDHGRVHEVEQRILTDLGQPGEHTDVELATDDCRQAQHPEGFVTETLDAPADDVADARRQAEVLELTGDGPATVVTQHDVAVLAEVAKDLTGEERVAVGLPAQGMREPDPGVIELVAGRGRDQLDQLVVFQTAELHPGDVRFAVQIREQLRQRVPPTEVGVAIGARDRHVHLGRRCNDMSQQLQGRGVGPMQIVEHHHHGCRPGRGREQLGGAFPQQQPLRIRVGYAIGVGTDRRYRTAPARRVPRPAARRPIPRRRPGQDSTPLRSTAERKCRRLHRSGRKEPPNPRCALHARPAQRGPSCPYRLRRPQTPLGRAWPRAPACRVVQRFQFRTTAEESEQRIRRRTHQTPRQRHGAGDIRGFPQDLDRVDRVGQALQHQRAHRNEGLRRVTTNHQPDEIRGEDLPTVCYRTQARRFHDRFTEEVGVLFDCLPRTHADPHAQVFVRRPIVMFDRLLHTDRAHQRTARRREHHHQPVTEVLHLGPARRCHRAAQQPEMRLAQFLGGARIQARRSRG